MERNGRSHFLLNLIAVGGNLVPFALCFALFGGSIGNTTAALVFGGCMTVLGIVLTLLFRAKWEEKRFSWLISICCLGAAKGGCAAALLCKLSMAPIGGPACLQTAFRAAGIAFGAAVLLAVTASVRPTARLSQVLVVTLPFAAVVAAIVLLICVGGGFFVLLLLNLLTVAFCSALFWFESEDNAEARFILSCASMLYATLLFFVVLFIVSEGECCEGADCDCPGDCSRDGKKKK